jgi:hypothetical protein
MRRLALLIVLVASGCGSKSAPKTFTLQLSTSSVSDAGLPLISMQGGDTKIIELFAVGASSPITFSGANLPRFAALQGPILTLSPSRQDAGDFVLTLTATDGSASQSTNLEVLVQRYNTPPTWDPGPSLFLGDDQIQCGGDLVPAFAPCPKPLYCTAHGTPKVCVLATDAEGDGMTIDVEVVLKGRPFSKRPTYSAFFSRTADNATHRMLTVSLPGLPVEQSYSFSVRISDEFGAMAPAPGSSDGWSLADYVGFDQGPCTTRKCACLPSGPVPPDGFGPPVLCSYDFQCCSGVCTHSNGPYQPGRCQ